METKLISKEARILPAPFHGTDKTSLSLLTKISSRDIKRANVILVML